MSAPVLTRALALALAHDIRHLVGPMITEDDAATIRFVAKQVENWADTEVGPDAAVWGDALWAKTEPSP
jgi:hypothetical protein